MSDLDEDTGTKLLRILVEQSIANRTVDLPPLEPTSSALAVSTLWFLSIISSLAATTWAMLCLEWCTFLTEGRQAEDYEEMAEKRQRRFEAVKRWRMHMVVAFIPFLLHISLFLFLAGLWLRLRDVDRRLGLIVGIPGLIIAASYVIVTLLPLFTEAPFSTAATEMIQPLVDKIKRLYRSVHAPPIFPRISSSFSKISNNARQRLNLFSYECLSRPFWIAISALITPVNYICKRSDPFVRAITITLGPIFPRFKSGGNPFKELKKLKVGRKNRDKAIQQRALFWLMNTPLTQAEVKEVLKEFRKSGKVAEPLDPSIVKLLVLSLSSVLENGDISHDEQPIFDHCTRVLAEEMDRAFGAAEYTPGIMVRNTAISSELEPYLGHGPVKLQPENQADTPEEHWERIITPLWLSPSTKRIEHVVQQLESTNVASMKPRLLQRAVRALHATMITSLLTSKPPLYTKPILDFPLPDFRKWELWEDGSPKEEGSPKGDGSPEEDGSPKPKEHGSPKERDKELSAFLQRYFAEFYKSSSLPNCGKPTTVPSLIIDCLALLDDPSCRFSFPNNIHSALCFFVVVLWRSDPDMLEAEPSVASALVKSAAEYSEDAEMLAVRLLAIAYGPKHLASRRGTPLEDIGVFYRSLSDTVREDPECIRGFLHANAATLETVLATDDRFGAWIPRFGPHHRSTKNIVSSSSFTNDAIFNFIRNDPRYRLPYLYSLAITLSGGVGGNVPKFLEVFELLTVPGDDLSDDRILDTNVLVVTVLNFILSRQSQSRIAEPEAKGQPPSQVTQTLGLVQQIIANPESPWRLRWKSIYLLADIDTILPQLGIDPEENKQLKAMTNNAVAAVKDYVVKQQSGDDCEPVPSGWEVKRGALMEWGLAQMVEDLARRCDEGEGVYEWRKGPLGSVPYLALYPQQTPADPTAQAPYRLLRRLQR